MSIRGKIGECLSSDWVIALLGGQCRHRMSPAAKLSHKTHFIVPKSLILQPGLPGGNWILLFIY